MTSDTSEDVKEVLFINGDAKKEFDDLGPQVREMAEARLSVLQNGGSLPSNQVRSLKGKLSSISEIRLPYDDDTYRVYYATEFLEVIIILDAGIKKSPRGGAMPRWQAERLQHRLDQAKMKYAENINFIRRRFEERSNVRAAKVRSFSVKMTGEF